MCSVEVDLLFTTLKNLDEKKLCVRWNGVKYVLFDSNAWQLQKNNTEHKIDFNAHSSEYFFWFFFFTFVDFLCCSVLSDGFHGKKPFKN